MRLSSRFFGMVVAAALFVACDETSTGPGGTVNAAGITFSPDSIQVSPGNMVVTWGFFANGPHSVTFEDGTPGSGGRPSGAWSRDFTGAAPGVHRYRCEFHSTDYDTGMIGQVVVP